jgi:hypothetical protein
VVRIEAGTVAAQGSADEVLPEPGEAVVAASEDAT